MGLQHSADFVQQVVWVIQVLDDFAGKDGIEGLVVERQALSVDVDSVCLDSP